MGLTTGTGKFGPGSNKRGPRASATAQLSAKQRALLAYLLDTERALLGSSERAQVVGVKNDGIPWQPSAAAQVVGVSTLASLSKMLGNLEQRRLVCCWAKGEGRGRRVHHIKLSAEAVTVAEFHKATGKSRAQASRAAAKRWATWQEELAELDYP